MTMAQQYFQCHQGADAKVVEQARKHLATSYKRLTGFEVPSPSRVVRLVYVLSGQTFTV
jgi:cell division protein FtsB